MKRVAWISIMILVIASFVLAGCSKDTTTTSSAAATTSTAATTASQTTSTAAATTVASTAPVSTDTPQYGGTVRFITNNIPMASIGVPERMQNLSVMYAQPMIEPLIQQAPNGTIVPLLATSVEMSNNNLTVTVKLREGVTFHDGSVFNSSVVIWNFDRSMEAKNAGWDRIVNYKALDDYTVEINLDKYQNTWIGNLMGPLGLMISKEAYEKLGPEGLDWNPVGTGPFIFKEYSNENYLLMTRNDNYWGGKPYFDAVKYIFIADAVTAQIAFESGEGDIITLSANAPKAAEDLKAKGYVVVAAAGGLSNTFVPSVSNPDSPLNNLKVRQAIEYAIDKDAIADNLGKGYDSGLYQFSSPVSASWIENFEGRRYDPDKARALLTEAGYPNGFKTTLYGPQQIVGDELVAAQAYLQQVGIDCDVQTVDIPKWIEMETNGWEDGILESPTYLSNTWGLAVERYIVRPTEPNWSRGIYFDSLYRTDELEANCQAYLAEADVAKQTELAQECVQILFDNCSLIPLIDTMGITVMTKYVQDYTKGMEAGVAPRSWAFERAWFSTD